jgi:hypothetical protein
MNNPNLNQDIIYKKATEVKRIEGETCEVISEKEMLKAKKILQKYWNKNQSDTTWAKYNRQYMIYNSKHMGTVVYVNGACLEKPASYFEDVWCLGMASSDCYYDAMINLKKKKVIHFEFRKYAK